MSSKSGNWETSQANPKDPNNSNYNSDGSGSWSNYQKPSPPQSTFPPLDASGGGKVTYNADKLTQVAKAMQDEIDTLNGSNVPLNLSLNGTPDGGFTWDAGINLMGNAGNASMGVTQFYEDLSNAYNTVIGNIHTTVTTYNNADQATTQAANNAGG